MELKLGNLTRKHVKNTTWPKEKKIQTVAQWLALGNLRLVSATTGVPYGLIRQWKMQPWWKEYEIEIRNTDNIKLDNKLSQIVERSLEAVADRLEHGDHIYDQKTGEIKRKPVNMKDAAKVSVDLLTKRELLRGNATARTEQAAIPVQEQLKLLAQEFARMTGKEVIDVEAVEVVQDNRDANPVLFDDVLDDGEEVDDEPIGREFGADYGVGEPDSSLDAEAEGLPGDSDPRGSSHLPEA
jgi:hypothetical protein